MPPRSDGGQGSGQGKGQGSGQGQGRGTGGGTGAGEVEVLLIGGRSGSGKSTLGWEVSVLLREADVAHCLVEGDTLDQVYPAPPGDPSRTLLTERNLAALWRTYAALGHRRLIYTNTVSVLEPDLVARAVGSQPRFTAVVLTATDDTVRERLAVRETGSQLGPHLERSAVMAAHLDAAAPEWAVRLPTDGRTVVDLAREVASLTGWLR